MHTTILIIYLYKNTIKNKIMSVEKIQVQMRKGVLEYCILSIIKRGDAYASDIIDELKKAEMIVVEGTLYPLLTRLKNENLLQYRWEESTSGPPRKYYALTEEGEQFLEQLALTWTQLKEAVNKVTKETT